VHRVVTSVVGLSTKEILGAVGEQLDSVIVQIDEMQTDVGHIKNRLDSIGDKVDGHSAEIRILKQKIA